MAIATKEEIRELVEDLPEGELDTAKATLQRILEERRQAECDRKMLDAGLLRRVPTLEDVRKPRTFRPIRIEGKSVSETLIEERR